MGMLLSRWFFRVRIDDEAQRQQSEPKQAAGKLQIITLHLHNPLMEGR